MVDLKTFLQNFLDTIEYPDNKEEFIDKLLSAIYLKTIEELLDTLAQGKQTSVKEQLKSASNFEFLQQIVSSNFEQKTFQDLLKINSEKIFSDYVETISPALSNEQKDKLQVYFSSQNLS